METRICKSTGRKISLLGFGCMRLPKPDPDKQDIDTELGERMIDYAYRHGVNYFDTAYPYHEGKSELFIGRALEKYPRESFNLADKMPGWLLHSRQDGERIFAEQLKKCRVEYFDFYLCHALSTEADFIRAYEQTGVLDYLRGEKQAGRIRNLGFSFHGTPPELEKILRHNDWDFTQLQLNYLDWDAQDAKTQYRILADHGIPCVVMEPVRGGALNTLCEESLRVLKTAEPNRSAASWAIRFAASQPNVLTVLSGMSTSEQVRDNIDTMTGFQPLAPADYDVLKRALRVYLRTGSIPCTGCRYCMDCPSGVDIPKVFAIYNQCAAEGRLPVSFGEDSAAEENRELFRKAYDALPEKNRAGHCVDCKKCMQHCPQKIRIPSRMREIAAMTAAR